MTAKSEVFFFAERGENVVSLGNSRFSPHLRGFSQLFRKILSCFPGAGGLELFITINTPVGREKICRARAFKTGI